MEQTLALIEEHLVRRPGMEPRDIYKLLYQGVRGPEHLISSPAFIERLRTEWEALDLAVGDPMWESIRPDGKLLRLNLRPFKAEGGNLARLTTACLETGQRQWGTQADLQLAWEFFTDACKEHLWPDLVIRKVSSFSTWVKANDFPAVHHSKKYRDLYQPSYRLVTAEFILMG